MEYLDECMNEFYQILSILEFAFRIKCDEVRHNINEKKKEGANRVDPISRPPPIKANITHQSRKLNVMFAPYSKIANIVPRGTSPLFYYSILCFMVQIHFIMM